MKTEKEFWSHLRKYFTIYMPKQRNTSPNTITSSKQTWNLLLGFITEKCGIALKEVSMKTIDAGVVGDFLDHMESERKWKPSTRNHRLSMIRSFFNYVACVEPSSYIYASRLETIPLKKGVNTSFILDYMSENAIREILNAPDTSKRNGVRDQFFLSLMYDSAARDCEMLAMKLSDFTAETSSVYLMGKGSKPRLVPVSKETVEYFSFYKSKFHSDSVASTPMFYTKHNGEKTPMSDDNVARFLKKYSDDARLRCNEIPVRVHPHQLRKSRAMHLYQGGMPLSVLAEFLCHEDPETTLIYARADTDMKRKAMEKASNNHTVLDNDGKTPIWEGNDDIIEKLCRGYG